ncbi:MAG: 4-hydroxyphenylacetate 3-hydroxylase N-terminal domain-containing protein [Chloroflexota bacterium]
MTEPTSTIQTTNHLPTGATFLDSLDDGREIWFEGQRVQNITTHPAFCNAARSVAHLYDALHNPSTQDDLTTVDKFGIQTHTFFAPAYSADDLVAARKSIAIWQRLSYGWMGRTPDYKAAFMAQLAEGHGFYEPYGANALAWYKRCASQALFINHVLIDPPMDRNKARVDVRDVYLSVDRDDDKGIYVSGAKMVATGSALTHATFVAVNSGTAARMEEGRDEDMALVFLIDMNAPGLKLITRPSYEYNATSPFDAPLASRFDENDAVMVFENAFIPWENVLVYRDVNKTKGFYATSGFFNRFNLQSAVRLATKLEFCIGLLMKGTDASGTSSFRGVQAAIGELISMRELIWSLTTAMVYEPEEGIGGTVVPRIQTAAASRVYTTRSWHRVREIFESVLAGAPIYTVSSHIDMQTPELQGIIDQYYQGTDMAGPERVKLFKLIWDALYSEFAGRHALYERNYAGNQEQHYLDTLRWSQVRGDAERYCGFVDDCLADYNLDGWSTESIYR